MSFSSRINPAREGFFVASFLALIALLNTYLVYSKASDHITNQMKNDLSALARVAAASVDADLHQRLINSEQEETLEYDNAVAPLRKLLKTLPEIRFIYTGRLIGDQIHFILDATPIGDKDSDGVEDHSFLMDVYENPDKEFLEALKEGETRVSKQPYKDKWGTFITGYAPFFDSTGKLQGVAGMDMKAEDFTARISDFRRSLFYSLMIQWSLCGLIGTLVYLMRRRYFEMEVRQRRSLERYSMLNRLILDVVWEWDLKKDTIQWGENLKKAFGYEVIESQTDSNWRIKKIHPDDRERILSGLDHFIKGGGDSWSAEYRFIKNDGEYADILDRGILLRDAGGSSIQALGIMMDMTERKNMQKNLTQLEKLESVGALAGGVGHELNNHLTPLIGYLNLLSMEEDVKAQYKTYLLEAEQAAKRCSGVVSRLMSFSRPHDGETIKADLAELGEQLNKIIPQSMPASIKTEIAFESNLFPVACDGSQLQAIIMNLVQNAREAMPQGGELKIKAANENLSSDKVQSGFVPGSYVKILISDSGQGIIQEALPKIFDPFFTTKPRHEHSGLGLSMAYKTIKGFGGWIDAETVLGKGTIFSIYLPALLEQRNPDGCSAKPQDFPGKTVLVVDDTPSLRDLAKTMLNRLGYHVLLASDGQECVELYKKKLNDIQIILMDVIMPKCSGRQALKQLLELNPSVKVVLMSGYTAESSWKSLLKEGASGYLNKPFTMTQVKEVFYSISSRKG